MPETLRDIGEFGLIRRIHEILKREGVENPGVSLGIGDDCAAIKPRDGFELLVTCDSAVEGRHFLPDFITPFDIGRRVMTMNISDIGAMGGRPLYALVSLGLKAETNVEDVEDMYRGFARELNPFRATIVGGNLTKMNDTLFIDITLIGEVESGKAVRRSTAQPGDSILVTGHPGRAAAGLHLLLRPKRTPALKKQPLVEAYNTPTHRMREGRAVALTGRVTAMIDTSDGFLADLSHICEESGVGAELVQKLLPISEDLHKAAAELDLDSHRLFYEESDDYELIITCLPTHIARIKSAVAKVSDVPVTEVGRITDTKDEIWVTLPEGRQTKVMPAGWDHFKK